jgi:hypothetical protein
LRRSLEFTLLKALTKTVLETALNEEMTEHLGHAKHAPAGVGSGNIRNGTRAKTRPAKCGQWRYRHPLPDAWRAQLDRRIRTRAHLAHQGAASLAELPRAGRPVFLDLAERPELREIVGD